MLAYTVDGNGTKDVVLIHGFCGSHQYWDKLLPHLSDEYRWILPDLRGHGDSASLNGGEQDYTMERHAHDLADLLDHLEIQRVVMLGHSLGGYVSLAFAERYPDRLAGLGLIHSTALPDDEKGKEGRLKSIQTIQEDGLNKFIDGLIPKLFASDHIDKMSTEVEQAKQIGYGTDVKGAIHTLEGMRTRPDRRSVLKEISVPILLLAGENDSLITPDKTFSVDGDHVIQAEVPLAGHMSMMETPEPLADAIHRYLQHVQ